MHACKDHPYRIQVQGLSGAPGRAESLSPLMLHCAFQGADPRNHIDTCVCSVAQSCLTLFNPMDHIAHQVPLTI